MKLTDDLCHLGLSYVASVSRTGYRMTVAEFESYTMAPKRKGGGLNIGGLTTLSTTISKMFEAAEPVLDYLVRVKWVTRSHDHRVMATPLGLAVLQALDDVDADADAPVEVILSPDDPLAYSHLIGRLAEADEAMVIDPYFRLEQLLPIAMHTDVRRVLTGDRIGKGDRASLADAVPRLTLSRPFEVRIGPYERMHDRLIIPKAGQLQFLGTSLGGVGSKLTVTGHLGDVASDALRDYYDLLWSEADLLGLASSSEEELAEEGEPETKMEPV